MNLKPLYKSVTAYAPASVANVSCGFDILGFALENTGDNVTVKIEDTPTDLSTITCLGKYAHLLSAQRIENTAGIAIDSYLKQFNLSHLSIAITLHKNLPIGSGIGSSASSAVAAVVAVNELFGQPLSKLELLPHALEGERFASGAMHADNVAPSLLGGLNLIKSCNPIEVYPVPTPSNLQALIIHPQFAINTAESRKKLNKQVDLNTHIKQSAHLAGLILGLTQNNPALIKRSLIDEVIEPQRGPTIPGFLKAKETAIKNGALGCSISGSGPSLFAIYDKPEIGLKIEQAINEVYQKLQLKTNSFHSKLNAPGAKIIAHELL